MHTVNKSGEKKMAVQSRTDQALPTVRLNTASSTQRTSRSTSMEEDEQEVAGIEVDRVSFINTALCATPGSTLRTFFAPVMTVKSALFRRKRLTEQHVPSDEAKRSKMYQECIRILTKAIIDASLELFEVPMPLDEKDLAAILKGKLTPACYEPGAVLVYPGECPESQFVHVVLSGSVQVVSYHAQNRKSPMGDGSKRQYFSSNEILRLNGSLGFQPELFRLISAPVDPASDVGSDVASVSNVSSSIQRTLRRASRVVGQPTLWPSRTELFRAPYVSCAAEALGLEPFRLATATAEAASTTVKGEGFYDSRVTVTMRIRARDLHNSLMELALRQSEKNKVSSGFPTTTATAAAGSNSQPRHLPTLLEYIAAARVKCISRHYPVNEILMRQSWLLQDTPAHTIRVLVTHLTPRFYAPGEIILCPHTLARQLCFLRRGTMVIEEPPAASSHDTGVCRCEAYSLRRKVLQEIPVGASFGELSVLFSEPRQFVLRAQTACDIWCLPQQGFTATIRRDDTLRRNLLTKAAALRMRWLGEQRFTASLAQVLRDSCQLFREVPDSFIRLVQERIEPVVYPPGTLLTSTSTRCEEMLIILHGRVSSIVDGVAEYGPGSVIGEPTIIMHRWPLGLVSKSMVEGWKLSRPHLRDVLRRIEILRRHSGEVGAHATQLMQHVFAPPIPQCDVDAVGRSRMPLVGPPPRGHTYMGYAKWLAEVQLKAMCFRFRDFVKWDDISYSALSEGERDRPLAAPPIVERDTSNLVDSGVKGLPQIEGVSATTARRTKKHPQPPPQASLSNAKKGTKVVTGSTLPFYVNPLIAHQPFTLSTLRRPPDVHGEEEPLLVRQRALNSDPKGNLKLAPMPNLEHLKALLDSRDKLRKVETKQNELIEMQQERAELSNVARFGFPAPVHIFLQGSIPRVEITVEEAISIGYVLQFPDTKSIQSCVSAIDSDVTIGLPLHRQRRRDMALTPNIRHHKYCFLFAASQLGEKSKEEVMVKAAAMRDAEGKENAQYLTTLLMDELSEKHGRLSIMTSVQVGENDSHVDWQRSSALGTLFQDFTTPEKQPSPRETQISSSKEVNTATFLRQLQENPDRAINNLRSKLNLPQDVVDSEAFNGSHRSTSDLTSNTNSGAQGGEGGGGGLLANLRRFSEAQEVAATDVSSSGPPPRRPQSRKSSEENGAEKVEGETEGPLAAFMESNGAPLFVDGYGQLGASESNHLTTESQTQQKAMSPFPPVWKNRWNNQGHSGKARLSDSSAWTPRDFVMPTVKEATATMRRMQRDVDGLNAVADEQRRERIQKSRGRGDNKDNFSVDGSLLTEYHRLIDEWTAACKERARDSLCETRIPPLLISESGTDYLAEEFQRIRRQQQAESNNPFGADTGLFEVDGKQRSDGKGRDETNTKNGGKGVLTVIGAKKLGLPSKPLQNPMANLSQEEYQRWIAERDAMFEALKTRS